MTKLEELMIRLTTIIVRYHDKQATQHLINETDPKKIIIKYREHSESLLTNTANYQNSLDIIIRACTSQYQNRAGFLNFLFAEINYLKALTRREKALTNDEMLYFKAQMVQLITEFQILLNTYKSNTCTIHHSEMDLNKTPEQRRISGIKNDATIGSDLCLSGTLLTEEVFELLRIKRDTKKDDIQFIITNLCQEHQNTLLVKELTKEVDRLTVLCSSQEGTISELNRRLSEDKDSIITNLQNQLTAIQRENTDLIQRFAVLEKSESKPPLVATEANVSPKETRDTPSFLPKFGLFAHGVDEFSKGIVHRRFNFMPTNSNSSNF